MDLQKLEQLESRISGILRLVAELKEKNHVLESKADDLERELSGKISELEQVKVEKEEWDQEREVVRSRVETMLQTLDNIRLEGLEERTF